MTAFAGITADVTVSTNMVIFAVSAVVSATAAVAGMTIITVKDKDMKRSITMVTVIAFLLDFAIIRFLPMLF